MHLYNCNAIDHACVSLLITPIFAHRRGVFKRDITYVVTRINQILLYNRFSVH